LRGNAQYVFNEMEVASGLSEQIADLEQYLASLGLNLEDTDADIRAAIEADQQARREGGKSSVEDIADAAQEAVADQHLSLKDRRKAHPYHIELWGRLSKEERETIEHLLRLKKSKQGASWKQIPESTRVHVAAYIHYANGTFTGRVADKDIDLPPDFNPHAKRQKTVLDIIKNHVEKIHEEKNSAYRAKHGGRRRGNCHTSLLQKP